MQTAVIAGIPPNILTTSSPIGVVTDLGIKDKVIIFLDLKVFQNL